MEYNIEYILQFQILSDLNHVLEYYTAPSIVQTQMDAILVPFSAHIQNDRDHR